MRVLILVKASAASEAGQPPDEALMAAMATYLEDLAQAGVLLDAHGLQPSREGWRIGFGPHGRQVTPGPFAEAGSLVAAYTLIDVPSREAALEWTRRFPPPCGEGIAAEIEVRPLVDLDHLAPSPAVERARALDASH